MGATTADQTIDCVSSGIVDAIAAHADTDPLDMEPLYNVIDLEALDSLIECGTDVRVSFEYANHTVVVDGDATVIVDGQEYDDPHATEFES